MNAGAELKGTFPERRTDQFNKTGDETRILTLDRLLEGRMEVVGNLVEAIGRMFSTLVVHHEQLDSPSTHGEVLDRGRLVAVERSAKIVTRTRPLRDPIPDRRGAETG